MMARFAENYVLEPDGDGTVFTWTVAIEPKPKFALPMRVLSPVNRFAFGRMASRRQEVLRGPRCLIE